MQIIQSFITLYVDSYLNMHGNISKRYLNLGEIIMGNIESEIIQTNINGVSAEGYLSKPANLDSKAPGIVVIQEWWGLDDHIKSITERFA